MIFEGERYGKIHDIRTKAFWKMKKIKKKNNKNYLYKYAVLCYDVIVMIIVIKKGGTHGTRKKA